MQRRSTLALLFTLLFAGLATACAPPPPEPPQSRSRFASRTPEPVFAVDISMWSEVVADHHLDCMWEQGVRHVIVGTQVPRIARQQLEMAIARGMTVDAYVYLWWDEDMVTQVREALALVEPYPVGRLWLDIEDHPGDRTPAQLERIIQDGLDACGAFPCGIYTGAWWWRPFMNDSTAFSHVPLWYAWYDLDPSMDTWATQRFGGWESPVGKQWNEQRTCDVVGDVNTMYVDAEPSVARTEPVVEPGRPPAPTGLYPDGALRITNDEMIRTMVRTIPGATRYELELEQWNGWAWRGYWKPTAAVSSVRWSPPYRDRAYRWRARAENAEGVGPWSAWARFDVGRVASPPPAETAPTPTEPTSPEPTPTEPAPEAPAPGPDGMTPADGTRLPNGTVTLERAPVSGADRYEIEIEHWNGSAFAPYYTYAPSRPQQRFWPAYPDRAYRWRARARVGGVWQAWTSRAVFLLGDAAPVDGGTDPAPTEPPPEEPAPAEPTPEEPAPAEPTPEEPAPTEPTSDVPSGLTPDGASIGAGSVSLAWDPVTGADRYEASIEYLGTSGWRTYYTYAPSSAGQSFWPSVRGTSYRFRVRARVSGSYGAWSSWASFDVE